MRRTQVVEVIRQAEIIPGHFARARKYTPFMRIWEIDNATKRVDVDNAWLSDYDMRRPFFRARNSIEVRLTAEEHSVYRNYGPFEEFGQDSVVQIDLGPALFPFAWRVYGTRTDKYSIAVFAWLDWEQAAISLRQNAYWKYLGLKRRIKKALRLV